ncbi:alkaline shock response membrane anchor protein AmaP [Pectinatus haikarae]|uniref:Alkaline shock family protein YloU n=1 Tax=Pectinatus haikarae TaxID=349096 RepID=A0ABT9Y6E9_9FIRM|nr:alkaline shock response membrane anchor protein AmaP [Pectinatus haikarae]MDQ0203404.1 putative alkaline shock family protein YloU [Pectinatus haikarae]
MGIINRFLLFFYTACIALLSLGVIVLCTGVVPPDDLWNDLLYILGRAETIVAAALVFLISIELMGNCFASKRDRDLGGEGIIVHGAQGDVKISKGAILGFCTKLCSGMPGVRDVKVKVRFLKKADHDDLTTDLKIKLMLGQEYSAVDISDEIQKNIKSQLALYMGLDDVSMDIIIDNISASGSKKKRVI